MSTPSPEVLWTPDRREAGNSAVAAFARYVRERYGLPIADTDYAALHAWWVDDIDSFWSAAAEFLGVRFHDEPRRRAGRDAAVGGAHRRGRRAGVRAGPVRPSAVGALLVRDDGPAQGHRPRPRRDRPGALEGAPAADGPRPGGEAVLVHHHRVDDVEPAGLRAADRRVGGAVRRQPGPPGPRRTVAARRAPPRHLVRDVRALRAVVPAGRAARARRGRPVGAARRRSTGSPLSVEGFRWIGDAIGEHVQICSASSC
jgi:hypothetical protein